MAWIFFNCMMVLGFFAAFGYELFNLATFILWSRLQGNSSINSIFHVEGIQPWYLSDAESILS